MARGERLVVVKLEHLLWEWRVVCQYAYRVIVNVKTVFHGFDYDAARSICKDPVELGAREVFAELGVGEIHGGEFLECFF